MKHKKILAVALVACMAVGVLAGCGAKDKEISKADNNVKKEVSQENKKDKEITDETSELDEVYQGLEITPENLHLADVVNASRLLEDSATYLPILNAEQQGAETAFTSLGISESDMAEYAICMSPVATKAYAVAVVKPAEGKTDVIKDGMAKFIESQTKSFENTSPEQLTIAKEATISEHEGYLVLLMTEDKNVEAKIADCLVNADVIDTYLTEQKNADRSFQGETNTDSNTVNNIPDSSTDNTTTTNDSELTTNSGTVESTDPSNGAPNTSSDWQ